MRMSKQIVVGHLTATDTLLLMLLLSWYQKVGMHKNIGMSSLSAKKKGFKKKYMNMSADMTG